MAFIKNNQEMKLRQQEQRRHQGPSAQLRSSPLSSRCASHSEANIEWRIPIVEASNG